MKLVAIKVVGSDSDPLIIDLWPGVTARDILAEANLTDCVLSSRSTFFPPEEVLYDLLKDGEALYAPLPMCRF